MSQSKHRRKGRGGTGNFYVWAKINAKFGQNIKISEKFWNVLKKNFYLCENYVKLGKILYVRQNFRMFVEKYLCPEIFFSMSRKLCWMFVDMSGKFFWYFRKKIVGDLPPPIPPPPLANNFGGEILMSSLPVRANYTVPPPNKIRPIRPCKQRSRKDWREKQSHQATSSQRSTKWKKDGEENEIFQL
jgi:hypothetical protein